MRKIFIVCFLGFADFLGAQQIDVVINQKEVERIETTLASDDMMGRALFTPGINKAAKFIADEFKKAGLKPVNGDSYFQEFKMIRTRFVSAKGQLNGKPVEPRNIVAFSMQNQLTIDQSSDYEKLRITAKDTLYPQVIRLLNANKNYFVVVDTVHTRLFNSLKRFRRESFPFQGNMVLVLSNEEATSYSIEFKQEVTESSLQNVVGILPGARSRKEDLVIFSAHYDHLGIGKPTPEGDSIYNGANDDASGVTGVIMLAKYFSTLKNNERTLIFSAFTAEEIGGYGSQHFSKQYDPNKVVAMFNIEMIGTESKWGDNSAFITGYEKTDMGKILEKNIEGTQFKFYPDPYPQQQLFFRSDNATLARLGVPAHTISTSKMDSEKFYHTADDEIQNLNLKNMTAIIKAIAISSVSIVSGKDAPTRVDTKQLR